MASEIFVNIGSGIGLSTVLYQAITWTNADIKSIGATEKDVNEI